jgi:23S rRNA (guanine1835-N2)-methyltransferase
VNPIFNTPFGNYNIACDNANDPSIQGWNQADHYLLSMLALHPKTGDKKIAILNDDWGALSIACQLFSPEIYSDSAIFKHWLNVNLAEASAHIAIKPVDQLLHSQANVFLMRLPKNLHFFQHQLSLLSQLPNITVYVAGMQKYWPATFYHTANDYFENCKVMEGIKKAKCMILINGKKNLLPESTKKIMLDDFNLKAINYPNVFSRDSLDLACGNGLLGIFALKANPQLHTSFIDESYYATLSCAASCSINGIDESRFNIHHNDALHGLALEPADTVLCNPPFHQLHRIGDHIANTMMKQSYEYLKPDGTLFLIGNRHLNYNGLVKKYFGKVSIIAENAKFILLAAKK